MDFRDLLRRLGLGSDGGARSTRGVRRQKLPPRSAEQPTAQVGAAKMPESNVSAAGPPATEMAISPLAPQSPPRVTPRAPAPAPVSPPPAPVASGATQYFRAVEERPEGLVGILVGINGPLQGQIYKIHDGENKLGREDCNVLLADPTKRISRYHAKITHMEGAFVIEANNEIMEKNPTLLNDSEIDAEGFSDGDILRLGDCTFKFRTI